MTQLITSVVDTARTLSTDSSIYLTDNSIRENIAFGVILPVLPTVNIISVSLVKTSVGGNLYAVAHLGYFAVNPIFC